jgi:hypothetical protein
MTVGAILFLMTVIGGPAWLAALCTVKDLWTTRHLP